MGASHFGKNVVLHTDKATTVAFINHMKGDILAVMKLLRHLEFTCLSFQILVKALYIDGVKNVNSNLLFRLQTVKFLKLNHCQGQGHHKVTKNKIKVTYYYIMVIALIKLCIVA